MTPTHTVQTPGRGQVKCKLIRRTKEGKAEVVVGGEWACEPNNTRNETPRVIFVDGRRLKLLPVGDA